MQTVVSSSCRTWSYSLIATQKMIAVTSSKQWIHFLRSDLWPPTSNSLKHVRDMATRCTLSHQLDVCCGINGRHRAMPLTWSQNVIRHLHYKIYNIKIFRRRCCWTPQCTILSININIRHFQKLREKRRHLVGMSSRNVTSQLGQLSLASLRGH